MDFSSRKNEAVKGRQSKGAAEFQMDAYLAEQQRRKKSGLIIFAVICFLSLITIMYISMFPLPIYEEFEAAMKNDAETIDIWGDSEAMQEKHREMIKLTQDLYEKRRDEIINEVMNPNSSVGRAVHNRCQELLATEYSGYTMGNINWDIPERNYTLSAEEADMILYLYSCQFDWDFFNGQPTNFIKWLYGMGSSASYEMKAMSKDYTITGHGGYFMDQEKLNEARSEARKAAKKAYWEARFGNAGNTVLMAVLNPFVDVAYAADESALQQAYSEAYQKCLDEYAANYGASALDTIIYTNVSDQINGKISFTVCAEPYYKSDPIKVENFEGSKAEEEAKKGSADPMHYRVVCLDYTETSTYKGAAIAWESVDVYDQETGEYSYTYTYEVDWERYKDSDTYVIVLCYAVIPSVDFTATANINASGIGSAMQTGVS